MTTPLFSGSWEDTGVTFFGGSGGGGSDPSFSHVKLLVSGIGTNGATVFPDLSSANCGNGTRTGSPTISTSSPITGFTSSIVLSGASGGATDFIQWISANYPNFQDPTTTTAKWTIEMVWKPSAAGTVFAWGDVWSGAFGFSGFVQNLAGGSFRCFNGNPASSGNGFDFSSAAAQWANGTEYFIVLESNGSKIRLYLGTLAGGTVTMIANTTAFTGQGISLPGGDFWLGENGFPGQSAGKFNWIRCTSGVARYNSDSAVAIPTFPLPTS